MAHKLDKAGGVILLWLVANLLGAAAVGAVSLIPSLPSTPGIWVSSLLLSLPIGLAQWIGLRRIAPVSILWILTVPAGLLLFLAAGPVLGGALWGSLDEESVLALTAGFTTIGLLVGLAQWPFLRGRFTRSWAWPLSSAAGLGLGTGLVLATGLFNRPDILSVILSVILVALVYSAVTGFTLSWMPASPSRRLG